MNIELPKDARAQAIASIARWLEANADEPIGNIQAAALLNFLLAEIGPSIYNQAITDAQQRLLARVAELDIECHADEFGCGGRSGASAERGSAARPTLAPAEVSGCGNRIAGVSRYACSIDRRHNRRLS